MKIINRSVFFLNVLSFILLLFYLFGVKDHSSFSNDLVNYDAKKASEMVISDYSFIKHQNLFEKLQQDNGRNHLVEISIRYVSNNYVCFVTNK